MSWNLMRAGSLWFVLGFFLLLPIPWVFGQTLADVSVPDRIAAIRFEGNRTTRPEIMLQEMTVSPGDPLDPRAIKRSQQAVMDLGLFKTVDVDLEPTPNGYVVVVTVEEKFYVLPIPRVDAKPEGDYRYGLELRFDNLLGLNQRLEFIYQHRDFADPERSLTKEAGVDYSYPRVRGTPYRLDFAASRQQETVGEREEEALLGEADLDTDTFGFRLSRWLVPVGPSRGWQLGGGLLSVQRRYDPRWGNGAFEDSRSRAALLTADYLDVREYRYHQEGVRYGYVAEFGLDLLGSDHSYNRHLFHYTRYRPSGLGPFSNLNWRVQVGLADGYRFGDRAFTLGGGDTLRGHESRAIRGDVMWLFNLEFLHPLNGYPFLRGALFLDMGNAYPGLRDIDLSEIEAGVGVGVRWRVQSLVNVTLNLNYAVDVASGNTIFYGSTSRTF